MVTIAAMGLTTAFASTNKQANDDQFKTAFENILKETSNTDVYKDVVKNKNYQEQVKLIQAARAFSPALVNSMIINTVNRNSELVNISTNLLNAQFKFIQDVIDNNNDDYTKATNALKKLDATTIVKNDIIIFNGETYKLNLENNEITGIFHINNNLSLKV